jgi:hypothetical protein
MSVAQTTAVFVLFEPGGITKHVDGLILSYKLIENCVLPLTVIMFASLSICLLFLWFFYTAVSIADYSTEWSYDY